MKRFRHRTRKAAFLSGLLLAACLLAACAGPAPASAPTEIGPPPPPPGPGFAEDSFLNDFCRALEEPENLLTVTLLPQDDPGLRVVVDEALWADIARALYYGAMPEAPPQAVPLEAVSSQSVSSVPPAPTPAQTLEEQGFVLQIEIAARGGLELRASLSPAGPGCVLAARLGQNAAEYSYSAAVYRYIFERVQQNLQADELVFDGAVQEMSPPAGPANASVQWMDCAGGLAALSTWMPGDNRSERTSALEIFDPENGKRLFWQEIGAEALHMEPSAFLSADMRVVMADGAMWYLNSQDPAVGAYYFYLPDALRDRLLAPRPTDKPFYRFFDGGVGQGAVWALSDEEGLHWARRSRGDTIPSSVILENLPAGRYQPGTPPPQFGRVRVMNGGATLVATVVLPDSQMGDIGIFTYQIASGEMAWYFGMFRPMQANLRFVDEQNLHVAGVEEIFRLNVVSGETETTPVPEGPLHVFMADDENFVYTSHEPQPDGGTTQLFAQSGEEPFLAVTGGAESPVRARGLTARYLILDSEDGSRWFIAPRPQAG